MLLLLLLKEGICTATYKLLVYCTLAVIQCYLVIQQYPNIYKNVSLNFKIY